MQHALMSDFRPQTSDLRTDVPAYPGPPDRVQWEREHGVKPLEIVANGYKGIRVVGRWWNVRLQDGERLERFQKQAKAVIERDYTTLDRVDAITEQTKLEHICERVKVAANVRESDHVFFDPQDGRFWVYPDPKRPTLGEALGKEPPHTKPESDE